MEPTAKKNEVKASAQRIHLSPRKVRLVADLVRNLPVTEALLELNFVGKKAALPLKKLLHAGVANALTNFQIEQERLFIKKISVDGGRVYFRFTPRAQGRAFPLRKRTSNINLILGVKDKLKIKRPPPKDILKPVAARVEKTEQAKTFKQPSGWKFWKKKARDPSEIPANQDARGKKYTGFDRRGNM